MQQEQNMQLQVHGQGVDVGDRLRDFVERRCNEGLQHFDERLTRVEVHLRDLNGQKGGVDKRCTCEARPRGLDPIAVEHDSTEITEAVQGAIGKLQRALQSRFDKRDAHR